MTQNEHIHIGRVNTLLVDRYTSPGLYLVAADGEDVLLPNQYYNESMKVGDLLDVFVYTDSEDRLVSTTLRPTAMIDEFGLFEVVDTTKFGAFVNWGLPKDLFVPKALQKQPFQVGDKKLLRVVIDEQTDRLIGTQKFVKYLDDKPQGLFRNSAVEILIYDETPLGYKCIVDNKYNGLVYRNEVFETVHVGDKRTGYVKNIRNDGNIDISIQKIGQERKDDSSTKVLELIKKNGGSMPYNYKSDSQLITDAFGMSKKAFKHSLTVLQEKNLIEVKDTGIYLK
ncbi:S1-like domain-containing RNA-binding protein [Sulfurimonas sp. HSL3-2]|uniref:CvfB family protein n=1 Tax=Hydrocurvibacter mobilis TaxID=3131936 RepID=UPI0031F8D1A7